MKTPQLLLAIALGMTAPLAYADDKKQDKKSEVDKSRAGASEMTKPKLDTAQVMKITQDAVKHIAAAERALARNEKSAAKSALAKSEKALARLYDTRPLKAFINEIDEAIQSVRSGKQELRALDLAPISASFRSYESYMDPEVLAGIDKARERARQNDAKGAEEELRKVRDRVAVEVALLPVEEAYVRVLAAQQALQNKQPKVAAGLIRNVPIVVSEVQVSRPLVPIRFKLHAAAEAAESGNWQQAQKLVREVNQDMQRLEGVAETSTFKTELAQIGDDIERLSERMQQGTRPQANQLRELATRTRKLVDTEMDRDRG